jgi:P27 family predicted phage terminase small subunit
MRGRKPKPVAQQIAEGDPRRHGVNKLRERMEAEPKASRGLPPCPKHLGARAKKVWKFWAEELEAMNLDRRPDAQMLEGAAVAYEAAVKASEMLELQGSVIAKKALDPTTQKIVVIDIKAHPAVAQRNAAWALVRAFCSEFGFSPSSRARLSVDTPDRAADDAELMAILTMPRPPREEPIVQ